MDDSSHYYTKPGGMSHWGRHTATNSEWGAHAPLDTAGANTDPSYWVAGTGEGFAITRLPFMVAGAGDYDAAGAVSPSNEVFCLSCHKGHGSDKPFALRWDYSNVSAATHMAGCQQCHADK